MIKNFKNFITTKNEEVNTPFDGDFKPEQSTKLETPKTYTKEDVATFIMTFAMDHFGDEWVAQDDEGFLNWLKKEGLYEAWDSIYHYDEPVDEKYYGGDELEVNRDVDYPGVDEIDADTEDKEFKEVEQELSEMDNKLDDENISDEELEQIGDRLNDIETEIPSSFKVGDNVVDITDNPANTGIGIVKSLNDDGTVDVEYETGMVNAVPTSELELLEV